MNARTAPAITLVLSLAAGALAQSPEITTRVMVAQGNAGGFPQLPAGTATERLMMFDDDSVIVGYLGGDSPYLADGQTLRPIMVRNSPIPGQPGITWGGRSNLAVRPLTGGGAWFWATTIGATEPQALFGGDFDGGPFYMLPIQSAYFPVTPSGMRIGSLNGFAVGRFDGPLTTVVPTGYVPAGRTEAGTVSSQLDGGLNSAGAVSLVCRGPNSSWTDVIIADAQSIRITTRSDEPFQTDRGAAVITTGISLASQPVADHGVFVRASISLNDAAPQPAIWLARADGPASIVYAAGDPAPGAGHGITFSSTITVLAANRAGSFLFLAGLAGPGIDTTNDRALYLWRRGTLILVARKAADRALPTRTFHEAIGLNEQDEVGFVVNSRAVLFKPGIGSVEALRTGSPLPASTGISFPIRELDASYGNLGEVYVSGGDDTRISQLTQDGRFFLVGRTEDPVTRAGSRFALTIQLTAPGCPADFNNDGFTDFFDYSDFVECFEGGRCPDGRTPDFNNDDFADFFDYSDFVTAFESPC